MAKLNPMALLARLARPLFPQRAARPAEWRSVLVLKPCCIGDVLQSTALVACLRQALPGARLVYAVGPWSRPVLEANPRLDALIDTGPVVGGSRRGWAAYLRLAWRLRRERFDACFVLERSALFPLLAWLAGIPTRIGHDSGGRGFALTVPVPVRPRRQEAEAYLDLARAVGLADGGCRTEFQPAPADLEEADRLSAAAEKPLVAIAPAGGVNPGGALVAKRWPSERFGELARLLAGRGYECVILGGPQDHELAREVVAASGDTARYLCGKLTLPGCGALLSRAALFIGNDTGLMHLAAAAGAPVLALFGPTDPAMYAPYGGGASVFYGIRSAAPPASGRESAPPIAPWSVLRSISVEEAESAALDLLL